MSLILPHMKGAERRAFAHHLIYSLLEGVSLGILALNEFVFVKSLQGSSYQLGLLFQFSMVVFLFLVFLNEFFRRISNKRRLLRSAFVLSRLPLLFIAFFPTAISGVENQAWWHAVFLMLFLFYYMGTPIIFPSINSLLKFNYDPKHFGRLYSIATSANKIVMLAVTFAYGYWLDINPFAFVWAYPAIAILGIIAGYVLSAIPYAPPPEMKKCDGFIPSIKLSIRNMLAVLKNNVPYRHFEIGFMIYGFAFMATVTVITLFFYEGLDLNYSSVAFYRNAYNILAILLLPVFGKMIGFMGPRRFATISYGSIVLYLLSLIYTQYFPGSFQWGMVTLYHGLIFYVIFHGVFASSMPLLWNIGSAYFCRPEEAGLYQEVHLSLTGFRALFAPLLGVVLYEWMGFTFSFLAAIAVLLVAIVFMIWSYKHQPLGRDEAILQSKSE